MNLKNKLLTCFFSALFLQLVCSHAQITVKPLQIKDFQPTQLMLQIVHNQANLHLYDVFPSRHNKTVKFAFLIEPGIVEIITADNVSFNQLTPIYLAEINYNEFDKATGTFALINKTIVNPRMVSGKRIVDIENYSDSTNYMICAGDENTPVTLHPAIGGIIDTHYNAFDEENFGVRFNKNSAVFKFWSPPAAKVELLLYLPDGTPLASSDSILLSKGEKGVWTTQLNANNENGSDIEGLIYQYRVFAYGQTYIALDPFAFSMAEFNPAGEDKIGKGVIVKMDAKQSKPEGFEKNYSNTHAMANHNDLIAWEIHVRDFTSQPGLVSPEIAGTYNAFAEKSIYLKNLGVTHAQLLPVMNFYTVNEQDRSFSGRETEKINYNWGYDPHNFFTPEGWFSTDPSDPYARIRELRGLIQSFHNQNVGVIMDVVFNHTHIVQTFENAAPGCYYRFDENMKISGHSGAGPSLETRRPMVRKLIIESLLHFINEYHVDGFRFDLMGFMDHETMLMIRDICGQAYDSNNTDALILQGEGWLFSDLDTSANAQGKDAATTKLNYPAELVNLGIFNDVARDAIAGKPEILGFVLNNNELHPKVVSVIVGGLKNFNPGAVPFNNECFGDSNSFFANSISNCLNFLSVHDGFTLWDKLNLMMPGTTEEERALVMRMASLVLFTSAGKIILHGGDEILRTKPLADFDREKSRAHTAEGVQPMDGVVFFHENSYSSPDFTNMIRWDKMRGEENTIAQQMHEYYRGLIMMRRSLPAFRSEPAETGLRFLTSHKKIKDEMPAVFSDFSDPALKSLTIRFINGPEGEVYYVAGEIHRKGVRDNPVENPYYVHFDKKGKAEITFDEKAVREFDLQKWDNPQRLEIKLVKHMGAWETIDKAYSATGNNSIDIRCVDEHGVVTIDLGEKDFAAVPKNYEYDPFIAYIMDNNPDLPSASGYENAAFNKILVVHNPSDKEIQLEVDELSDIRQWFVIADAYSAGISPLEYSPRQESGKTQVQLEKGKIIVPSKNSAVVVRM